VTTGRAEFDALLVYDVSRWGRFQDPDEAASYELACRRAGVQIHYCAEQFENDGSIGSSIIKTVKRAMAGEYSRELSVKVFAGQAHLIRLGFRQGGAAGFGLRRMLVDQDGREKGVLDQGQHKSITTDRVVLVPGPISEVEVVREIYGAFVHEGRGEREIADELNRRGIATDLNRPWTRGSVHQLLINEKYIGNNVWARTSCKLKGSHVPVNTFVQLRKLKSMRQIAAAEMMIAMNKYSISYAKSIVAATPSDQLVMGTSANLGISAEQAEIMTEESVRLDREFKAIEDNYGVDHLDLVLASAYLANLLENARVVRHLAKHHAEFLSEFQKIAELQRAA